MERDTVESEIVPAYGSGASEHRHAEAIGEWKERSEKGEVCGIFGCQSKPALQCPHCRNWYCEDHKYVIGGVGHPIPKGENTPLPTGYVWLKEGSPGSGRYA